MRNSISIINDVNMMDCGDEFCTCQICGDNKENGGTCSHCFTCINGQKAEGSNLECFSDKK